MVDPLADVVTLLQPTAPYSKLVGAKGPWRVRRPPKGQSFYCVILHGECRLVVGSQESLVLNQDDFVLIPSVYGFEMSSIKPPMAENEVSNPLVLPQGEFRLGVSDGEPDVSFLLGHCVFGSPDAALLVSLLPEVIHITGRNRLITFVRLVAEEAREVRPVRDVVLSRLLELLFIDALRSSAGTAASPGLLRGLADERLAVAIRCLHEDPTRNWSVAELAKSAAMSRSAFYERFTRAMGIAPMEYLLGWRMALAKDLLRKEHAGVAEVAKRVGYGSSSAFSVAFSRHVGVSPTSYSHATK